MNDIENTIKDIDTGSFENMSGNIRACYIRSIIDLLYTCMDDYLYLYDFVEDYYYISPSAMIKFPLETNSFHDVVKNHELVVYPPDLPILQADLEDILNGKKSTHNLQYRWMDRNGRPVWIICKGTVVRDRQTGEALYMAGCINEIGAKQKADNTSGLLRLASLKDYLDSFTGPYPDGYILRLGLDDFKEINENLGIDYGDMLLFKTAECIQKCTSSHHKIYRATSDEFIVIDFNNGSTDDALELYRSIRHSIERFVEKNHYTAVFTISGGLLTCEAIEQYDYSNVLKLSEFSLNMAKKQGKNNCYIFRNEDYDAFLNKRRLTKLLKQSIDNNFEGFEAYYQPLFKTTDGTLYGAETLMRFHDPEFGLVSPTEFIPVLEETKLIVPAGKWILREALKTCSKVQQVIPDFKISINVSYIQVIKSDIFDYIIDVVNEFDINPSCVIIELTESGQLAVDPHIKKMWGKLKECGIMVALDDFGTGYSNFNYLYDLKPDILKIDRTFTAQAMLNEYEFNLLSLICGMGHNLQLKICMEGIENNDELDRMRALSPEYCQGFFFGKPCPYTQFHDQFVLS